VTTTVSPDTTAAPDVTGAPPLNGKESRFADLVQTDRVDGRVYTDPAIFDAEMDRIFGHTWVYVAHVSEIRQPGDYKTTFVGRQPVVVTRDVDGQIRVLFNRCRHRASIVCREPSGNASLFRCPFHGWTYKSSGELLGVPGQVRYGDGFDKAGLALAALPRVDTYRGLIFASVDPDIVGLPEYLGSARQYLDEIFLHPAFEHALSLAAGANRQSYPANWKHALEGGVDGYHAITLHETWFRIRNQTPDRIHTRLASRDETIGYSEAHPHGHVLLARWPSAGDLDRFRAQYPEYATRLETEHGEAVLQALLGQYNLMIYPNLHLTLQNLRVITPVSPTQTHVTMNPTLLDDAPAELNAERLREFEEAFATGAFISPDDAEAFVLVQEGVAATSGDPWLLLSRGLHDEQVLDGDIHRGVPSDETPQRGLFREWRRLMSEGEAR
jgi:phenylpropionate dioxygenase-like ring-hydroxylating dioxygenase large terminal subunit